jgi:hypothetical protein
VTRKKLDALATISAMIRDREMAELARLNAERHRLEQESEEIARSARAGWREAQENVTLALAAESFEKWAKAQQIRISEELQSLQPAIEAQKLRTAAAAGRHKNLLEIGKSLHDEARKQAERQT